MHIRKADAVCDLDDLCWLEREAFKNDRISRASFRHFCDSNSARLIVACGNPEPLWGYAIVTFRRNSKIARLYSIVSRRRGFGRRLLECAEWEASTRGCTETRLEVDENNPRAICLYRAAGYELFGRMNGYYADGSNALRFRKGIMCH